MRFIDHAAQTGRWRRLPAEEKLLVSLGVMGIALLMAGWVGQVLIIELMILLTVGIAGVPFATWLRAVGIPTGFIAVGVLAQFVSVSMADDRLGLSLVGPDTMAQAIFVGVRSFACVTALLFLALTTPLASLMHLLHRSGLPRDITDIALLMLRFVWLLFDTLETGHRAQGARLGHITVRHRFRCAAVLAAGLLPRALARAQRLQTGLDARGYDGTLPVLSADQRVSRVHLAAIAGVLVALGGTVQWLP